MDSLIANLILTKRKEGQKLPVALHNHLDACLSNSIIWQFKLLDELPRGASYNLDSNVP